MAAQDTSVGEAAESTRDAPVFVPPADSGTLEGVLDFRFDFGRGDARLQRDQV